MVVASCLFSAEQSKRLCDFVVFPAWFELRQQRVLFRVLFYKLAHLVYIDIDPVPVSVNKSNDFLPECLFSFLLLPAAFIVELAVGVGVAYLTQIILGPMLATALAQVLARLDTEVTASAYRLAGHDLVQVGLRSIVLPGWVVRDCSRCPAVAACWKQGEKLLFGGFPFF